MGDTLIFFDPIYERHNPGPTHPEKAERLPVSMAALEKKGLLDKVPVRSPRDATNEEIALVHSRGYIRRVQLICEAGGGYLDMDTALSEESYMAALKAAGAMLEGVDDCLAGEFKHIFGMVRPPGHHALADKGMGFCLFNNIAIAAKYAIQEKGMERIMIVDWDAHHGNGTQDIFYEDNSVLYVSLHQYPHYPGSGAVDEIGRGKGKGYTINFPFPPGTGEEQYLEAFDKVILPAGRRFKPDFILISAGYDSHSDDLLCSMRLIDRSYRKMTERLVELAGECCDDRLMITLEGGYNLDAMANSVVQTIAGLEGIDIPGEDKAAKSTTYLEKANEVISRAAKYASL